ncbi:hypothetical protein RICGR_0009 [Rickettsiella grylli]|uniref:Uncharacterized protein n=1 Tax=Rickettsiella grylli TaxID=59196 RepID=A8PK08_9COXI|nr:hypothetical protein RICGR_1542 [Rickettsiella grylli]EDP46780.1 hypothetical protein RICGR_0009 [Rickettsiella grylli]
MLQHKEVKDFIYLLQLYNHCFVSYLTESKQLLYTHLFR